MKPFPCRFIIYAAFNIFNLSSSSILQLLASISKWSTDKTSSLHHSFTNVSIHFYLILMVAHICHPKQCLKNQCLEVSRSGLALFYIIWSLILQLNRKFYNTKRCPTFVTSLKWIGLWTCCLVMMMKVMFFFFAIHPSILFLHFIQYYYNI